MDKITQMAKKSSRKQVPALFKKIPWVNGQRNLDWGGGKYDHASEWLKNEHGVTNMVVDAFNRTPEHNDSITNQILDNLYEKRSFIHTATLANVLNVIPDIQERMDVLLELKKHTSRRETTIYISCYNASGQPSVSECQTCMKLEQYLPEIEAVFNELSGDNHKIELKNDMIIIHPSDK